jgi:pimeloyl-ACP methyl ester carboxylesterase
MTEPRPPGYREPVIDSMSVRGVRHHLARWPGTDPAPVLLLHGYLDCGATFQFLADALPMSLTLLAPDWRGFGQSAWVDGGYWFPDYYADLDALLEQLSPTASVDLIGHSMGGNIALTYAGLRPERVRRVVCLEGFGLPRTTPDLAPARYRDWLRQLREPDAMVPTVFPSIAVLAAVLQRRNARLTPERAAFVARAWAEILPDGRARLRVDPAHKRVNPILYRRDEAEACWREVRAPVLYVTGDDSVFPQRLRGEGAPEAMRRFVPQLRACTIADCGHMLHHDQPERLAQAIEAFFTSTDL